MPDRSPTPSGSLSSRWRDQPWPRQGDKIRCGQITIRVGAHNGDFRSIYVEDHLGRPIAWGDVPYSALLEIVNAGGIDSSYIEYIPPEETP